MTAVTSHFTSGSDAGSGREIATMVDTASELHEHVVSTFQDCQKIASAMSMSTKSANDQVAIVAVAAVGTIAIIGIVSVHGEGKAKDIVELIYVMSDRVKECKV